LRVGSDALLHHIVGVVQQSIVNDREILFALLPNVYRSQLGTVDLTLARPHRIKTPWITKALIIGLNLTIVAVESLQPYL